MGLISKEEISKTRRYSSSLWRCIKTIFVLFTMLLSFILFSAPIFLSVADAVLPSVILSSFSSLLRLSPATVSSHLSNYDFRYSLIDIPLISIIRSAIILCVYGLCDGPKLSRGPYLTITMICSICSLIYVSFKAAIVFGEPVVGGKFRTEEVALFVCSWVLAIGHIVVAYRTSCRERRKLLVFKIDIESVSACKNVCPRYQKILLQERLK
ncbi:SUE4 [Hirschfeldia incana]|nr:SUE4 [Hirschfeldia incana]